MIHANELRIGNYVRCVGGNIIKINKDDMMCILTNTYEVRPIPLSEEILLKCGFEKDDTGVDIYDPDYHEWFQKEFPIIGVLCQNETKEYLFDENTDTLRIRCLHQLQNLYFALSEQELELTF